MNLAQIILPIPNLEEYTYYIPNELSAKAKIGSRVVVQFGSKKFYTGIIQSIFVSDNIPTGIKEIFAILDSTPIIALQQMSLWMWMSQYYMCSLGEIYKASVPTMYRIESNTFLIKNQEFELTELTDFEKEILEHLSTRKETSTKEIGKILNKTNIPVTIQRLVEKGAIKVFEQLEKDYKIKYDIAVKFHEHLSETGITDKISRSKRQKRLLETFISLLKQQKIVLKKDLLAKANVTNEVLKDLINKEILDTFQITEKETNNQQLNKTIDIHLSGAQKLALDSIKYELTTKPICLLKGVTSSGKTEIYSHVAQDYLREGKQVLYLLPEIGLTTQITSRLYKVYGDKLIVYHSKLTDNERAKIWDKLLNSNENHIILGVRSSIFLPFRNLGLIIVDEEHESSYKQQDTSPRYNARNTAIVLANLFGAKVLLGSATPSIESFYNALIGKYALVELNERYGSVQLPTIEIVDIKELRRKKIMKSILSPQLIDEIQNGLDRDEQAILFQNRRGFSPLIACKTCSWTPECQHCAVSLTYHKGQHILVCHYCGATYSVPHKCSECGTETMEVLGYGTERIEEEVSEIFRDASISRMDLDTTRAKRAYERIISDFENNKTNILIGTQMLTKGLDFDNVSIVGVINADNLLNFPDFRAHERAYQLMTQVSGRAGRRNKQGKVVIQTSQPSHPILKYIETNDYDSFFHQQLQERKLFKYPPYYRLIEVILRGKNNLMLDEASRYMGNSLRVVLGNRVLGPAKPSVSRIQSLHIRKILIKVELEASIRKIQQELIKQKNIVLKHPDYKSTLIHFDVDPL